MASLSDCPPEILGQILEELPPQELTTGSLTCRSLQLVAEPLLYSTLDWTWTFDNGCDLVSIETPPILKFLRTTIGRPALASYVKRLAIKGDSKWTFSHQYTYPEPLVPIPPQDMELLLPLVEKIDPGHRRRWAKRLLIGTMDSLVAILLSQLPNLSYLFLDENMTRDDWMMSQVLRRAPWDPEWTGRVPCNGFQHLKTLEWAPVKDVMFHRSRPNTLAILPLLYPPALKSLSISIDNFKGDVSDPVDVSWSRTGWKWVGKVGPGLSRLRSLTITVLREDGLAELLKFTPRLESLRWEWTYWELCHCSNFTETVDLTKIVTALFPIRHTLKQLSLSASTEMEGKMVYPYVPPDVRMEGSLQELTSFDKLVTLTAPLCFLMRSMMSSGGYRESICLPKNLESLTVRFDLRGQVDDMYDLHGQEDDQSIGQFFLVDAAATPKLRDIRTIPALKYRTKYY